MKRSTLLPIAFAAATAAAAAVATPARAEKPLELARKYNCLVCHSPDHKIVGPAYRDVAAKYKGQHVADKLFAKVHAGGVGVWGPVPMPPNPTVPDADLKKLIAWILAGAK